MINWLICIGVALSAIHAAHHCFLPLALIDKKAYFRNLLLLADPSEPLLKLYENLDKKVNDLNIQEIPDETKRKVFELAAWTGNIDIMAHLLAFGDADYDLLGSVQVVADRLSLDQYHPDHWSSALKFLTGHIPDVWLSELEAILTEYIGKKCHGATQILQVMMDDPRFPVPNSKMAMSLEWYRALIGLIKDGNYTLFRTIISVWKPFKTRIKLSPVPQHWRELIVEALLLKRTDMVFLLATRFWIFPSLRVLRQGPHRKMLLKIIPTLKGFDWTGIETNREGVLMKFLNQLFHNYPYHIDVQAALLGSSSFAIDKEEYISGAIRLGKLSHVLGAMKAGCLEYKHLPGIHKTGKFTSTYDVIDAHFKTTDFSTLEFRGEGRALVYLIENITKFTLRARMVLENLLAEIARFGPMKILSMLEEAHNLSNREEEIRSHLTPEQWSMFQTYPWEIDDGDLVYSIYRKLSDLKSADLLNFQQMRPVVLFATLNRATSDKDYVLVANLCTIIAKIFALI